MKYRTIESILIYLRMASSWLVIVMLGKLLTLMKGIL